jgi:hypothetical protein
VPEADGAADGVVEEDGGAVGVVHGQGAAGLGGDDGVDFGAPGAVVGAGDLGDAGTVDEVGMDDGVGVAPVDAVGARAVGVDVVAGVGDGDAEVEGMEGSGADAAVAGEDGMLLDAVFGKASEAEKGQAIVVVAIHGPTIEQGGAGAQAGDAARPVFHTFP